MGFSTGGRYAAAPRAAVAGASGSQRVQRINPIEARMRSASLQSDQRKQKRGFFDAVYGQLRKRGLA